MSRLSDKMDEINRDIDVFTMYEIYDVLTGFSEEDLSNLFIKDMIIYLNDQKTQCLTIVLLDSSETSIQWIRENKKEKHPFFITKNIGYGEASSLVKTIMRRDKLKKLKYG